MARPREQHLGRYELLIELGHGGMAELFLGRLHGAGGFAKLVAIKRILPHLARDEQFTSMFLDEGRIASRLSHPNVCQVFELDDADGELFLAMEYLDGVPWATLLSALPLGATAAPPLQITAGVLVQAADGLHYAHTLRGLDGTLTPVIHRDVSPQNLFVDVGGVCKVLDFGVAKMMTDGPRTRSGVVKGKLPYMAPEQIRGEPVDARTDVFSLGICLWEALAGERLYDRATDFLIWKAVTEEDAPAITTRWPGCPPAVAELVRRALAREPAQRVPTARAFADELRAAVPDLATTAQIGDALRAACGDRIAARQKQVATAIAARSTPPRDDGSVANNPARGELADGRRSNEVIHSAAATLESGRSAAMTLDDKPAVRDTDAAATQDIDPGATTDLRSGSKRAADVQLRDKSVLVTRDSDQLDGATTIPRKPLSQSRIDARTGGSLLDPQAIAAAKQSRLGLIVGALAAVVVIAVVIVIAMRSGSQPPVAADAALAIAVDAAFPGTIDAPIDPPITIDAAAIEPPADAAIDAAVAKPVKRAPDKPPVVRNADIQPPRDPGQFSVTSDPYATIYVDGTRIGDTPLFRYKLAAGKHTVKAVRADGREQTFSVEIEAGKERNVGKLAW